MTDELDEQEGYEKQNMITFDIIADIFLDDFRFNYFETLNESNYD